MDNKIIFIPLVLVLFIYTADGFAEKRDFRNVSWGMTRLEVMANEDIAPESFELNYLFYKPEIDGRRFNLIYEFVENSLTNAEYIFSAYRKTDYLWLKNLVQMKYGLPFFSFDGGTGNYQYKWKNKHTEITLKPGRERECRVKYVGKKYQYLKKERAKEISLTKLKDINNTF